MSVKTKKFIAAFLWCKSPKCSIATMIFDETETKLIFKPISYDLPKRYFAFRKHARIIIKNFFGQLEFLANHKNSINIEYKILFPTFTFPYFLSAKESRFVYKIFMNHYTKVHKRFKNIVLKPQLRRRLKSKDLKKFKSELRKLHLVSRKRNTGFEYHLWIVALHATAKTYKTKLQKLHKRLAVNIWSNQT